MPADEEYRVSHTIDVAYVAELARLELEPEEKSRFQQQLETIVKYVEKIGQLDLSGIEPPLHGQALVNVFREDVVSPSIERERALANAPARNGFEFRLPKIVEDA
jgi:aspartyl-tRNA(Asn)/glutamyl-tRNA(Gln) amidotransferase subunit C